MKITRYHQYIVLKILEDFRNYSLKDAELIKEISKYSWSDLFRLNTRPEKDYETILDILTTDQDPQVRFAHMLLRPYVKEKSLRESLKKRIKDIYDNSHSPVNKIGLIYDLLEFDDIAQEKNEEFLDYIEKNREIYISYEMDWYENEDALLSAIQQRVTDKINPFHSLHVSKKWIYLYNLSLIINKTRDANDIINKCFNDDDDFLNKVKTITKQYLEESKSNIDFESFYKPSYDLANLIVGNNLFPGCKILDLGCGNSPYLKRYARIAFKADCVDLNKYIFTDDRYDFYNEDANLYLQKNKVKYDFVIINASLHELWVKNKGEYLKLLIDSISDCLNVLGKCYIGDYYYSGNVTLDAFASYKETLEDKIGHADGMDRFYNPSDILIEILSRDSLKVIESKEIKIEDMVERFFYGIVWQKL